MLQQKIVIRVSMSSEKSRSKAMELVARADGTNARACPTLTMLKLLGILGWLVLTVAVRACVNLQG